MRPHCAADAPRLSLYKNTNIRLRYTKAQVLCIPAHAVRWTQIMYAVYVYLLVLVETPNQVRGLRVLVT